MNSLSVVIVLVSGLVALCLAEPYPEPGQFGGQGFGGQGFGGQRPGNTPYGAGTWAANGGAGGRPGRSGAWGQQGSFGGQGGFPNQGGYGAQGGFANQGRFGQQSAWGGQSQGRGFGSQNQRGGAPYGANTWASQGQPLGGGVGGRW